MFDVWLGEVELTTFTLVLALAAVLPGQLLLCFKVRSRFIRLLPLGVCLSLTAVFAVLGLSTPGWDGLGYVFLTIFAGFLAAACGLGWGIWALWSRRNARHGAKPGVPRR